MFNLGTETLVSANINVLVTGSMGQLGSEIKELSSNYNYNFFFTTRDDIDITSKDSIKEFCQTNSINVIINCAKDTKQPNLNETNDLFEFGVNYYA